MKITIRLQGTLGLRRPDYRPTEGITADVPEGTSIAELFTFLDLPLDQRLSVIMDGRIQKMEAKVSDGACIYVLQPMHGG